MKLEVIGINYDIGVRLKEIIEKKVLKLEKYFSDDTSCKVVCKKDNKNFKLEITIVGKDGFYRSEVLGENMYENIDLALPKVEKQIVKHSGKKKDVKRHTSESEFVFIEKEPESLVPLIKKRKSFKLDPMQVEDAIAMLEKLDHDFYVFINAETGKIGIVYKRKDDDVGLIEINE